MTNLAQYAHNHGAPLEAFLDAGWSEIQYSVKELDGPVTYPALSFPTDTGKRYRIFGGAKTPKFQHDKGTTKCFYRLSEAIAIVSATQNILILTNGEASTVAAQANGLPVTCITSGEAGSIAPALIAHLREAYKHNVIRVLFDNDAHGRKAAPKLCAQLNSNGFVAWYFDWPEGTPEAYDIADWLRDNPGADFIKASNSLWAYPAPPEPVEKPTKAITRVTHANSTAADIQKCLDVLAPDRVNDRPVWINVGMIIRNELGDTEEALELWDAWSQNGLNYDDTALLKSWLSFKPPEELKEALLMGSLIKMAIEDSGRNPIQRSEINLNASTQAILLHSNPTDAGNADAFNAMYSGLLRFNHTRATWLIWNGIYWQPDTTGKIHQLAIQTAKEMYKAVGNWEATIELKQARAKWAIHLENNRPRNDMLSTAETIPAMATVEAQFDSDPLLLGVANGTLELSTGIFRAARQEDYITKSTHVHYDANAVCPTWIRFINDLFDGDAEMVAYMQRAIGYTLTGFNKEQIMFLMYGGGSNGKSTFLDTMNKLMGDYASATAFSTFDADNRSDNTNDLARLKGARFVAIVETNQEKRLDESKVKSVTGSDKISARFLYKEFFDYTPQFKIWLAVNHKPIIRGTDNGIWRRLQTIPFLQSFEGSRTNLDMPTLLQQELPGILNWALEGLREYTKQRLNPPEIIKAAAREYRNDSDMVLQWLNEQATIDYQEFVAVSIAYSNFKGWCEDSGIRYAPTKDNFSKRLNEKGYESMQKKVDGKNSRIYTGFTCGLYSP